MILLNWKLIFLYQDFGIYCVFLCFIYAICNLCKKWVYIHTYDPVWQTSVRKISGPTSYMTGNGWRLHFGFVIAIVPSTVKHEAVAILVMPELCPKLWCAIPEMYGN